MASVHNTRSKVYASFSGYEDEAPDHVESEGERLIKQMVQKQMETKTSLDEQLLQNKEFQAASEFVPLTSYTSGKFSLEDFKQLAEESVHKEELSNCGLTALEMELMIDWEKGEADFLEKYKKIEKSVLHNWLQTIKDKIRARKTELENARQKKDVSRHDQDLALSVKPESEHTKLLQFALSCQPEVRDERPKDHPIHHLKELEQELFGHLSASPKKRRKKRKKNFDNTTIPVPEKAAGSLQVPHTVTSERPKSLWDVKGEQMPRVSRPGTMKEVKVVQTYSCAPQRQYTIKDGKIVPLEEAKPEVPKEESKVENSGKAFIVAGDRMDIASSEDIQHNRLSLEQIKEIPWFKDYNPGEPSKVLFLKNLASSVKENDLVSLFGKYEKPAQPKLTYRLMTGRMKGQAFITFPNIKESTKALQDVNGYVLKGKPIILEFGKSGT